MNSINVRLAALEMALRSQRHPPTPDDIVKAAEKYLAFLKGAHPKKTAARRKRG